MAVNHLTFDEATSHGRKLRSSLEQLKNGRRDLVALLAVMDQMKDAGVIGAYLQGQFGFPSVQVAQDAYAELASGLGKITTDASVSSVNAALNQLESKFG